MTHATSQIFVREGPGWAYEIDGPKITLYLNDPESMAKFVNDLATWAHPENWMGEPQGFDQCGCEVWIFDFVPNLG